MNILLDKDVELPVGKVCAPDGHRLPKRMNLKMIVAMGRSGIIGYNGKIPWRVPADLQHFKNTTQNSICIVGRKTHEGIVETLGHRLTERKTVIITRDKNYTFRGCTVVNKNHIDYVLKLATHTKVFVIGGGEIYNMFMPYATEIIASYIDTEIKILEGEVVFFPSITDEWKAYSTEHKYCVKSGINFTIVKYKRE